MVKCFSLVLGALLSVVPDDVPRSPTEKSGFIPVPMHPTEWWIRWQHDITLGGDPGAHCCLTAGSSSRLSDETIQPSSVGLWDVMDRFLSLSCSGYSLHPVAVADSLSPHFACADTGTEDG